jgi:cell division control protein 6
MSPAPSARRPIIKDRDVFGFGYVPPDLPHRDKQLARLHSMFSQVVERSIPQTAFVTGGVGLGKTVMAKKFCSEMEEAGRKVGKNILAEIVNCRNFNTPSSVLHEVITRRFQDHLQIKGFSVPDMLTILRKKLEKDHAHLVLVLDEANALVKESGCDLVYSFTRFDEDSSGAQGHLSLMLISQYDVYQWLDAATTSTFKRANTITLPPYDAEELTDILTRRAELGLFPGTWTKELLEMIADIAAGENGDARRAIGPLGDAARAAEERQKDRITPDLLQRAHAEEYGGLPLERLDGLERHQLLALLGIARAMKKKEFINTGDAEKAYHVVCEENGEKPRGHTQFWKYLQKLDSHGIIDTRTAHEGTAGTTTQITLHSITPSRLADMVAKVLAQGGRGGSD